MIEANFDVRRSTEATVSNVYQYDVGQILKITGLPSPDQLSEEDVFLSGDRVSVQAGIAYRGDAQSYAAIALWDEKEKAWFIQVPDIYFYRYADVDIYIRVGFGASEKQSRSKTEYVVHYTPKQRNAPVTYVTPEQVNQWDQIMQEVTTALQTMKNATDAGNEMIGRGNVTIANMDKEYVKWENAEARADTLDAGNPATATMTDDGVKKIVVFGIPKGEKGDPGKKGDPGADGHTDVVFTYDSSSGILDIKHVEKV